jgi:hypothetical protein
MSKPKSCTTKGRKYHEGLSACVRVPSYTFVNLVVEVLNSIEKVLRPHGCAILRSWEAAFHPEIRS